MKNTLKNKVPKIDFGILEYKTSPNKDAGSSSPHYLPVGTLIFEVIQRNLDKAWDL